MTPVSGDFHEVTSALTTPTPLLEKSSLRSAHKSHECKRHSAYDSDGLIYTRSYHNRPLITTTGALGAFLSEIEAPYALVGDSTEI